MPINLNWRDASEYPRHYKEISYAQWAWEFLRRNQEYQRDYSRLKNVSWSRAPVILKCGNEEFEEEVGEPIEAEFPWPDDPMYYRICYRYAVSPLLSPDSEDPPNFDVVYSEHRTWAPRRSNDPNDWVDTGMVSPFEPRPGELAVKIKLDLPIGAQVKSIRKLYRQYAEKSNMPNVTELPKLLRTLDAHLAGVGPTEIGEQLYPQKRGVPSSRGRDKLTAAKSISEFRYLYLALRHYNSPRTS